MSTRIEIPGQPRAWARAGTRGTQRYTPPAVDDYEERIAWACRAARARFGSEPVACSIELWTTRALRGDIDNYAKAVLDGLQRGEAIANDRQVVQLEVRFVVGVAEPKTVVRLARIEDAAA